MSLQLVQIIKASKTNPVVDRPASLRQVKGPSVLQRWLCGSWAYALCVQVFLSISTSNLDKCVSYMPRSKDSPRWIYYGIFTFWGDRSFKPKKSQYFLRVSFFSSPFSGLSGFICHKSLA